jgi:2-phospho-L-lactate guanylyltransferase (CobY/MobA/RfbA family)
MRIRETPMTNKRKDDVKVRKLSEMEVEFTEQEFAFLMECAEAAGSRVESYLSTLIEEDIKTSSLLAESENHQNAEHPSQQALGRIERLRILRR